MKISRYRWLCAHCISHDLWEKRSSIFFYNQFSDIRSGQSWGPESLLVALVLSAVMRLHPWGPGVPGGPQGEKKERLRPPGAVP